MTLPRLSSRTPVAGQYLTPGAFTDRVTFWTLGNVAAGVVASAAFDSWASIRGLTGREIDKAQQIAQPASHLITIPYRPGVQASMTIQLDDGGIRRTFQIVGVEDPDSQQVELQMMCSELGTNAGSAP